jgi:hypothetical protein
MIDLIDYIWSYIYIYMIRILLFLWIYLQEFSWITNTDYKRIICVAVNLITMNRMD